MNGHEIKQTLSEIRRLRGLIKPLEAREAELSPEDVKNLDELYSDLEWEQASLDGAREDGDYPERYLEWLSMPEAERRW